MHGTQTEPAAGPAAARSAPPDPAAEISLVLERLASWLRRATPAVEWNSVALSTLALLARRGPLRITGLVAAERITQPGMTSLVRRMAAVGLVAGRRNRPTVGSRSSRLPRQALLTSNRSTRCGQRSSPSSCAACRPSICSPSSTRWRLWPPSPPPPEQKRHERCRQRCNHARHCCQRRHCCQPRSDVRRASLRVLGPCKLAGRVARGDFTPRAPTERNVTVSRHSALLT